MSNSIVSRHQLDRYGDWMRANGRRQTAKARSVAASMQVIRDEIARRNSTQAA